MRHALRLETFTIAWNVVEAFVAVGIGLYSGSVALVAFGFDSLIETVAAVVLFWRLYTEYRGRAGSEAAIERVERKASYWVGVSFFLLAAYVLYESAETLVSRELAHPGPWGVGLALLSSIVMPVLWRMKLRAADAVGSRAMRSEAAETIICAYLSFVLLAGLLLNYLFGWWWADPAAALVMLYFIVKEGLEAFAESRGEHCSCGCGGGR
ncbi:MAG: cation transporter [Nitrospirae bacterium]|nr:cation transporter [Nitrospirota bacterium]